MQAIRFTLSGKTACFRKPDVNAYAYFTYNNIHKPALLGILGAILGLGGHTQLHDKNRALKAEKKGLDEGFPEYYEILQNLKVSITPLAPHGYFSKKIQTFNNSVGYASQEAGGNLIVREQWLEKPSWQIMILDDGSDAFQKISEYLTRGQSIFIPYLGKNDHPATITSVQLLTLATPTHRYVDSLFIKNFEKLNGWAREGERAFFFQEFAPMRLQKEYHFYEFEPLIFTNHELDTLPEGVYALGDKNYAFI